MKMIWTYVKLYSMFILRILMLKVLIELAFFVVMFIDALIERILLVSHNNWPDSSDLNLISFAIAIVFAMKTTYFVDGKRGKVWSETFGFDPDKYKD